jgi:maleylpyruvate isomerase
VTVDPLRFGGEITRAEERLRATVAGLDDAAIRAPSLLPGWTRGHVLAHIARSADAHVRLLTWARTGVETPMYPSFEHRSAEIEEGAGRTLAEHVADLGESAERFVAEMREMTPATMRNPVRHLNGRELTPPLLIWSRLREVEVHHVDLDAGYGPADWPEGFTLHLLREVVSDRGTAGPAIRVTATDAQFSAEIGAGSAPVEVRGPARALAAWLIGRSNGDDLSGVPLPDLPTWK